MARTVLPVVLQDDSLYVDDRGNGYSTVTYKFNVPADFDAAFVNQLFLIPGLGWARKEGTTGPCPISGRFKPRKLTFTRRDGNTFSLVPQTRASLIDTAAQVVSLVAAAYPDNPIACVALTGERWDDLTLDLRPPGTTPGTGVRSRVTAGKQYAHSGKVRYSYDGGAETDKVVISVKVDTDVVSAGGITSAPTILAGVWDTCVGAYLPKVPCSGASDISPRFYEAVFQVGETSDLDDQADPDSITFQSTQIPVISNSGADIQQCGIDIASIPSLICLKYQGENNSRLERLFP